MKSIQRVSSTFILCGSTEMTFSPPGSWETLGFGLFAMYKSDWTTVGGWDVKKYTTAWGGEDWDIVDK